MSQLDVPKIEIGVFQYIVWDSLFSLQWGKPKEIPSWNGQQYTSWWGGKLKPGFIDIQQSSLAMIQLQLHIIARFK